MVSPKSPSAPKNRPPISLFWALSIGVHLLVLFAAGWTLVQEPEFSVTNGHGGQLDVDLSAGAQATRSDEATLSKETQTQNPDAVSQPSHTASPSASPPGNSLISGTQQGGDAGTLRSLGPDYLQNPAPVYPEKAKARGQEGIVLVRVLISPEGLPSQVTLQKSSGFYLLDDAALKAVKKWKFKPAKLGSFSKESQVDIPVRFKLEER